MTTAVPVLQVAHMDKAFGLTHAVDDVSLSVPAGDIVGVIGPNGAGKSTLMRLIAGEVPADAGTITIDGADVDQRAYRPAKAHDLGIRTVHQELSLCTNLKVFENFILESGRHSGRGLRAAMRERARTAIDAAFPGSGIGIDTEVGRLSLAKQQMVEIARAISTENLKVLILDEPTSALPADRVEQLKSALAGVCERGVACILITHRLKEIKDLTESVVVMRDGAVVHECKTADVETEELVAIMSGQELAQAQREARPSTVRSAEAPTLVVDHLTKGILRDVSLDVKPGEVVGVYGLEGSGQRELLRAIFAAGTSASGTITVRGGSAFVSGDRKRDGLLPLWPLGLNLSLSSLKGLSKAGVIDGAQERSFIDRWLERLQVKTAGPDDPITALSGGNQQKIIISRALATGSPLILLDDPTRGVDPRTKAEVYDLLHEAAAKGRSALFYSTEELELLQCDRVYVLSEGAVVAELSGDEITRERLVTAAFAQQEEARSQAHGATAVAADCETPVRRPAWRRALSGLSGQRWVLPAAVLVVMVVVLQSLNPGVLTTGGISLLIGAAVPPVLAAIGQMFVIGLGDIDLGLGSFIGFVNAVAVTLLSGKPLVGLLALVASVAVYAALGALIHVRKLPAIVATLGMSFVWLGLGLTLLPTVGGEPPRWLLDAYNVQVPVIPLALILVVAMTVLAWWMVTRTRFGILVRGFGNNPAALETAGWSALLVRVGAFAMAGLFGILAGLALTAVTTSGDPSSAQAYTLLAITSVVIGGSELMGGVIEPVGVVLGALVLSLVGVLLSLLGVDPNFTAAVTGFILIVVLAGRGYARKVRA